MIIGITGTLGAGKGTVVEYLKTKGFEHFAVSDTFLVNEAKKRGLEPDRITRRDIANEFRAKGPTKLMEAVYEMAKASIDAGKNVIIEPQHTRGEVEFIQSIGGVEFAVDANLETRYERIQKRGSTKDNVSFEQFKAEQEFEMSQTDPNMNNLGAAIAKADHVFHNDSTPEALFLEVEKALKGRHGNS
ncbi:MAG TPA: AAA family ATPase [Candidatus Paceibacterota bacterium]|nr:AAA family ATPase [Candidatus Paceibacterota bacterium]